MLNKKVKVMNKLKDFASWFIVGLIVLFLYVSFIVVGLLPVLPIVLVCLTDNIAYLGLYFIVVLVLGYVIIKEKI